MDNPSTADFDAEKLIVRLKEFCFPGGEEAGRSVRGVKTTQQGEFCMSPGSRWNPFTAEERIDATRSGFCWDARFSGGAMGWFTVTDAYEEGQGRLVVKLGGVLPVKTIVGRDADLGEIQRYLSEVLMCPPILLNHPSLEWTCPALRTLRVRDRNDPTGATVDMILDAQGLPLASHAERPRIVGKQTLLTPWSGTCQKFKEYDGLRAAHRFEAQWQLPDGPFTYIRGEITSFELLR